MKKKTPGTARKTMKRKPLAADHFGATYRLAIAAIPDADVRARVQALLDDAPNVVAVAEKRATRKLLALALQSPAVHQALVRIVECWPRRRKWLTHYCLAWRVVSELIARGKLPSDLLTLAAKGLVETWILAQCDDDDVSNTAFQIFDDLNNADLILRKRWPAVLLHACYSRLCDDPDSYRIIKSMLDGASPQEIAIMSEWRKSRHAAPRRLGEWAASASGDSRGATTAIDEDDDYEEVEAPIEDEEDWGAWDEAHWWYDDEDEDDEGEE